MIEKANIAAKPVITATMMMDSMISNPRPSRAEASDATNAVLDGSDCVMLSGETANGTYPIAAVSTLQNLCVQAEKTINYSKIFGELRAQTPTPVPTAEAVAAAAVGCVNDLNVNLVVVLTDTGKLTRLVAKYRPSVPIFAIS